MQNMVNDKPQLAELEQVDHRPLLSRHVVGTLFLAVLTCVLFACNVPGDPPEVTGTIVSVETQATKSGALRVVHVRLDDNRTVRATVGVQIAVQAGKRVALSVTTVPVIGFEQFDVKNVVEEQDKS